MPQEKKGIGSFLPTILCAALIVIIIILLLLGPAGLAGLPEVFYKKPKQPKPTPVPTATQNQADELQNWKTYRNDNLGISFKHSDFYEVELITQFPTTSGNKIYISPTKTINPSTLSVCESVSETLCLLPGKNWNQQNDVQTISLSTVVAKSFFVYGGSKGSNDVLHVVQTDQPQFEISMSVAGTQGEDTFNQILSTFKFLPDITLHKQCDSNDDCNSGQSCVSYYGFAGNLLSSCEIKCKTNSDCPEGFSCGNIPDGPGLVCSE